MMDLKEQLVCIRDLAELIRKSAEQLVQDTERSAEGAGKKLKRFGSVQSV